MMQQLRWFQAVAECERRGEPYVLITVVGVAGSVPREPSSKMLVTAEHSYDSIGGGHLEYQAIALARSRLAARCYQTELAHFPLGASLGQCCGGSVSLMLEVQPGSQAQLLVFGAGHVAQALVGIMGQLPWQVVWVDSRAEIFPTQVPDNVQVLLSDDPAGEAASLCADRHALILTHNHQLDYALCQALLKAGNARSIGLIGSATKAERFRLRLAHRGYVAEQVASIRCPVGLAQVPGKLPMEVALSIAAELVGLAAGEQSQPRRRGVNWPDLRELIKQPASSAPAPQETP